MIEKRKVPIGFIIDLMLTLSSLLLLIINEDGSINRLIAVIIIVLNVYTVIKVRNNWYLFIIFIFITYSNYSICMVNYLTSAVRTFFVGYAHTDIGIQGLNILLFFSSLLLLLAPHTKTEEKLTCRSLLENNKENPIIVIGFAVVLALIWVYGFTRPDLAGERGSPSALYEYSIILIIISLYYSGNNITLRNINIIIAVVFAAQNFIYGGRITGVQLFIVLALSIYIDKLSMRKVLPIGALFFILMSGIGQLRAQVFLQGFSFRQIIKSLFSGYFTLDTAYSSYYTSMTFLDEMASHSLSSRLHLFGRWVLSMFLGGSVKDSNLAQYTRAHFMHYYGGVLPYFAWFYLGVVGVLLLVIYLRFLIRITRKADCSSNGLVRCVTVYFCATTLRWYLYSPSQIFRGIMLLCLVYGVTYLIDSLRVRRISSGRV